MTRVALTRIVELESTASSEISDPALPTLIRIFAPKRKAVKLME